MDKLKLVFLFILFFLGMANPLFAQEQTRDYLYSEAYFDYLIECANEEAIEKKEIEKQQQEEILFEDNAITVFEFNDEAIENFRPFQLKIEENSEIEAYNETFKKPETKIIIPMSDKFAFTYNTTQYVNKNYTDGRKIISGVEFTPFANLNFSTGVETNYRDVDHNPLSRKFYFTPSYKVNNYLTISFLNKYNFNNYSSDHDLGLYISPFKTKAIDFKVFAGITNEHTGVQSHSASFYTNLYFF